MATTVRTKLCQLFEEATLFQLQLEERREAVAGNVHFQPQTTFNRIDRAAKGHIVPQDLSLFLQQNKCNLKEQQLYLAFKSIDSLKVGQLGLIQFSKALLPSRNTYLAQVAQARTPLQIFSQERLHQEAQQIVTQYFKTFVKGQAKIELKRAQLHSLAGFKPALAWNQLDINKKGQIGKQQIEQFLNKCGMQKIDINYLLEAIDQDKDGAIKSTQFFQFLDPYKKYPYVGYSNSKKAQPLNQTLKKQRNEKEKAQDKLLKQAAQYLIKQQKAKLRLANQRLKLEQTLYKTRVQLIHSRNNADYFSQNFRNQIQRKQNKQKKQEKTNKQQQAKKLQLKIASQKQKLNQLLKQQQQLVRRMSRKEPEKQVTPVQLLNRTNQKLRQVSQKQLPTTAPPNQHGIIYKNRLPN